MSHTPQSGERARSSRPIAQSSSSRSTHGRPSTPDTDNLSTSGDHHHAGGSSDNLSSGSDHGSGFVDGVVANFGFAAQGFIDAFAWPSALITTYTYELFPILLAACQAILAACQSLFTKFFCFFVFFLQVKENSNKGSAMLHPQRLDLCGQHFAVQ